MKKIIAFLVLTAMLLCLAGCQKEQPSVTLPSDELGEPIDGTSSPDITIPSTNETVPEETFELIITPLPDDMTEFE